MINTPVQVRSAQRATQQPLVLALLVFVLSLAWVLKSPEFSAFIISLLSKFPQLFDLNVHADGGLLLRNQIDLLQNLSTQMLAKGDWISIEIRPRSLPFGMKMKYILIAAATDISVIVPAWNEEKYLRRCLSSLVKQSYEHPFEVIVVDGGSTDQTVAIAEEYADEVLVKPGLPVGAARNRGAEIAKGHIFAFIDADTMASDQWLKEIARFFHSNPSAVGVTGPTLPYDGGTIDSVTYRFWTIYLQRILLSTGMPHVIGFNCAYRKESFLMAGGFDETALMSEDILLAQKMRQFGKIVFDKRMFALTSARRFQRCGHAYVTGLYLLNGFSTLLLKRSSRRYPPIR